MATEQDELQALVEQVPDEILDYIEQLEDRVEKAEGFIASVTELEGEESSDETAIEKALAQLPPEVAEMFKAQATALAEAQTQIASQAIAKADAEWTEQARSIDGLIDAPETFGPKLRAVADSDPELAKSIVATLQTANERLVKSALFSELGHVAPVAGSAEEKVTQMAKSLREVYPDKSEADALGEVLEANPDLYDQYTAERRSAQRS